MKFLVFVVLLAAIAKILPPKKYQRSLSNIAGDSQILFPFPRMCIIFPLSRLVQSAQQQKIDQKIK